MQEIVGGELIGDVTNWEPGCQTERIDQELQWLETMITFLEGQIRHLAEAF